MSKHSLCPVVLWSGGGRGKRRPRGHAREQALPRRHVREEPGDSAHLEKDPQILAAPIIHTISIISDFM